VLGAIGIPILLVCSAEVEAGPLRITDRPATLIRLEVRQGLGLSCRSRCRCIILHFATFNTPIACHSRQRRWRFALAAFRAAGPNAAAGAVRELFAVSVGQRADRFVSLTETGAARIDGVKSAMPIRC